MSLKEDPACLLLFSGKRKSGKDYLTDALLKVLKPTTNVAVIKISGPIKSIWADKFSLSFEDLMGSSKYKEKHRSEMIKWSDEMRAKDPGVFCRQAVQMYSAKLSPVWIVSDVRRKTDVEWFRCMYEDVVKTIRVVADEETRKKRGFVYTNGVDNVASECDLDDVCNWDWIIDNSDGSDPSTKLSSIVAFVKNAVMQKSGDN